MIFPPESLISKPWQKERSLHVPMTVTMLSDEEIGMLNWFSSQYYSGAGEIIDAGCFLGGSTIALASGLEENELNFKKEGRINSYDLFILEEYSKRDYFNHPDYEVGASIYPIFKENISRWERYVNIFHGDICNFPWRAQPIEILFIDVAKTALVNQFIVRSFLSHLIPGRSILIQQDYVHEWLPWIHITMEIFLAHFDVLDYYPGGSAIFLLKKKIPASLAEEFSLENIPASEQVVLMDQAIRRAPAVYRDVLTLPKVRLLKDLGLASQASELLSEIKSNSIQNERIANAMPVMETYIGW